MEKHGDEILAGAVLGIGCFLLESWHSTSIVLGDDGQVLILNAATEPVKMADSKCAVRNSRLAKLNRRKPRPFNTKYGQIHNISSR